MAVGTVYQGAWQSKVYQGAWQSQATDHVTSFSDTMVLAESAVKSVGLALVEGRTHDELEAFTHDEMEAFTHDELEHGGATMTDALAISAAKLFSDSLFLSLSHFVRPAQNWVIDFNDTYSAPAVDNTIHEVGLEDISISVWMRQSNNTAYWFVKYDQPSSTGFLFYLNAGGPRLRISDGTDVYTIDGNTNLFNLDDGWHHVAAVIDRDNAANCKIYLDGVEDGATIKTGTLGDVGDISNSGIFTAGWLGSTTRYQTDGKIYIASGSHWSDAEILSQYQNPFRRSAAEGTLTDAWSMNEGSGTTLNGLTNNLTLTNAAAWHKLNEVLDFAIAKPLSDLFNISEALATVTGFVRSFTELLSIVDSVLLGNRLNLSDTVVMSDVSVRLVGKEATESSILNDALIFVVSKSLIDSLLPVDSLAAVLGRNFSDLSGISDSTVIAFSKVSTDAQTIVDILSSVASFGRSFADAGVIGDSVAKTLNQALVDSIAESDSIFNALSIGGQLESQKDIAALLADPRSEVLPWMPWVAIGDDDTVGNEIYDTELYGEIHRKRGEVTVRANTYFVRATFGQDEPTGDDLEIKEIAIFDAASDGVMGKRWVLGTAVDKDNVDEIVVECAVTILHGEVPQTITSEDIQEGGLQDTVPAPSEQISFHLIKGLALNDSMAISDMPPSGGIAKVLSKGLTDAMAISDSGGISKTLSKELVDSMNIVDVLTTSESPLLQVVPLFLDYWSDLWSLPITVTNIGTGTLNWSLSGVPAYMTPDVSSGSLGAGASTVVTFSVTRGGLTPGTRYWDNFDVDSNGGTETVITHIMLRLTMTCALAEAIVESGVAIDLAPTSSTRGDATFDADADTQVRFVPERGGWNVDITGTNVDDIAVLVMQAKKWLPYVSGTPFGLTEQASFDLYVEGVDEADVSWGNVWIGQYAYRSGVWEKVRENLFTCGQVSEGTRTLDPTVSSPAGLASAMPHMLHVSAGPIPSEMQGQPYRDEDNRGVVYADQWDTFKDYEVSGAVISVKSPSLKQGVAPRTYVNSVGIPSLYLRDEIGIIPSRIPFAQGENADIQVIWDNIPGFSFTDGRVSINLDSGENWDYRGNWLNWNVVSYLNGISGMTDILGGSHFIDLSGGEEDQVIELRLTALPYVHNISIGLDDYNAPLRPGGYFRFNYIGYAEGSVGSSPGNVPGANYHFGTYYTREPLFMWGTNIVGPVGTVGVRPKGIRGIVGRVVLRKIGTDWVVQYGENVWFINSTRDDYVPTAY